jgi:ketosteroid isomerase-like protein
MINHAIRTTRSGLVLLTIVSALALPSASAGRRRHHTNPVPEIRAVLDRQVVAWNERDLEGFMEGYWKSAGLTFFSIGTRRSGWQEAIAGYRSRYQGEGHEMGHLDFSDLQIEMLGPRAAFVRGHWHLTFTTGGAGGLFTLIFRKLPEGWRIVHDHTSSES